MEVEPSWRLLVELASGEYQIVGRAIAEKQYVSRYYSQAVGISDAVAQIVGRAIAARRYVLRYCFQAVGPSDVVAAVRQKAWRPLVERRLAAEQAAPRPTV